MAQIFHRSFNFISRLTLSGVVFLAGLALAGVLVVARSPYLTNQRVARDQPVQFSHKHHVGDDGIDCRYCHTSVETSAYAGIPPTKTCMNCHSVLFNNVGYLEPVRESYRTDQSIPWVKVHQMPLVFQASPLTMSWCLDCHRDPQPNLRPKDQIFNMDWKAPADQGEVGPKLAAEYKLRNTAELTSCSTCHR
jgi:hypothetical protein